MLVRDEEWEIETGGVAIFRSGFLETICQPLSERIIFFYIRILELG